MEKLSDNLTNTILRNGYEKPGFERLKQTARAHPRKNETRSNGILL